MHAMARPTGNFEDDDKVFNMAINACQESGFSIVGTYIHKFSPQGCTAVVILGESHFAVHTYPELGYCFVDCFTCNPDQAPGEAILRFVKLMSAEVDRLEVVKR